MVRGAGRRDGSSDGAPDRGRRRRSGNGALGGAIVSGVGQRRAARLFLGIPNSDDPDQACDGVIRRGVIRKK